ncbi:MAG TPA: hypothetical protein VJ787_02740 [Thermoleophilia bacterium]|nr:hypothetical protein [Thermoleophilia bacterium]
MPATSPQTTPHGETVRVSPSAGGTTMKASPDIARAKPGQTRRSVGSRRTSGARIATQSGERKMRNMPMATSVSRMLMKKRTRVLASRAAISRSSLPMPGRRISAQRAKRAKKTAGTAAAMAMRSTTSMLSGACAHVTRAPMAPMMT